MTAARKVARRALGEESEDSVDSEEEGSQDKDGDKEDQEQRRASPRESALQQETDEGQMTIQACPGAALQGKSQ